MLHTDIVASLGGNTRVVDINMRLIKTTLIVLLFSLAVLINLVSAQQSDLKVYGFFDLEAEVSNKDAAGKIWTFDQHHLNFLAIYRIDRQMRIFTEVEYEHGVSLKRDQMTGKVYVAQSFFEYKVSDALLVRAGKFMSPFGIYNERHDATPTFISTKLPHSIYGDHTQSTGVNNRTFAKSGTGLQLKGNWLHTNWETGYQLYLTNGRGDDPNEKDDNANKGTGARLTVAQSSPGFQIGASFYSDRNGVNGNAKQTSYGLDAQFDHSDLHVESELVLGRIEESDSSGVLTGDTRTHLGIYVQSWYSINDVLAPFVRYEVVDHDRSVRDNSHAVTVLGLNFSLNSSAVLKGEVHFYRSEESDEQDYEFFITSIAVAF